MPYTNFSFDTAAKKENSSRIPIAFNQIFAFLCTFLRAFSIVLDQIHYITNDNKEWDIEIPNEFIYQWQNNSILFNWKDNNNNRHKEKKGNPKYCFLSVWLKIK